VDLRSPTSMAGNGQGRRGRKGREGKEMDVPLSNLLNTLY